jgi:hypothetical protein
VIPDSTPTSSTSSNSNDNDNNGSEGSSRGREPATSIDSFSNYNKFSN